MNLTRADSKKGLTAGLFALAVVMLVASLAVLPVEAAPNRIPEWSVISEAYSWLGVPYRLGGESRSGIDCSGLVRQVYMRASKRAYTYGPWAFYYDRNAQGIRTASYAVYPPRPGDVIVFVDKTTGIATHVGIFIGPSNYGYSDGYFIHAGATPGKVVLDRLYYSPYYGNGWWYRTFNIFTARYNPDYWYGMA
jgi:cell wall-associated NlpC family hydrolase